MIEHNLFEMENYRELIDEVGVDKFRERFEELQKTAMEFIEMAGFSETSYCNERILMQVILDYFMDVMRLKEFGKMQLTQLGLTFVYSLFIEFTSYGLFFIEPHGLAAKILLSVIACAVLSIGVGFTISSGFAVMPMEGLVKTISDKKNISFGAVRVCLEVLFTVCSAISSFVLLPELPSVGIGTVIAAFLSGNITNIFSSLFHKRINAYLGFQA